MNVNNNRAGRVHIDLLASRILEEVDTGLIGDLQRCFLGQVQSREDDDARPSQLVMLVPEHKS